MANPIRKAIENYVAKRLFGVGPVEDWSYVDQFQGPAKDIKLLGMYSGVAYRCINTIAEAMGSQYQPYFYTQDANGKKNSVTNHPLLKLLMNPNPDLSFYQLLEGSQSFIEQFGEFFWYVVPGAITGQPKQIYLLRPDRVGIVLDKNSGDVIGYNYAVGTQGNKKIPFTPDEVIHYMTFNPKNPYRGYATLEAAAEYVRTEEEVSSFTRNYFRNNASMSGILSVTGKVGRENWNKFVRQWRERYEGTQNAGKVAMVRDSQVQFTQLNSNISDMQLDQLKQTTVDQILMMFRIPKGLFGMESDQGLGRASVETLEYIFAKWTMDNKMSRLDDTLLTMLQRYFPKDQLLVDHVNIVPEDKEYMLNLYDKGVDRWITRKEIRDADPLTSATDISGSEQLFVTVQQIPLDDAGIGTGGSSTSTSSGEKVILVKAGSKKKLNKDLEYNTNQKEAYRVTVERNSIAYARKYRQSFNKFLNTQEATVLSNIKQYGSKSLADQLMNMSDEDAELSDSLMPVLQALVLQQGQLALEFSGGGDQKYSLSKAIINAIAASTKKMGQNFNQTTIDQLSASLSDGINANETSNQLAERVASVYEEARSWRSDRVSRTESLNASNAATRDAYTQNPTVTAMQWFANPGACEFCAAMDGVTVGLEESFVHEGTSVEGDEGHSYLADYGNVDQPPLHPNCTCTIIPVTGVDA